MVTTVAGGGLRPSYGFEGALIDGPAGAARFNDPSDVAVDGDGNLYVTDRLNHAIRVITPEGRVSTFAGTGQPGTADGVGQAASFELPNRIAIDGRAERSGAGRGLRGGGAARHGPTRESLPGAAVLPIWSNWASIPGG